MEKLTIVRPTTVKTAEKYGFSMNEFADFCKDFEWEMMPTKPSDKTIGIRWQTQDDGNTPADEYPNCFMLVRWTCPHCRETAIDALMSENPDSLPHCDYCDTTLDDFDMPF